ncbi:IS21-like element helper ATPase IstB [soil metagenome]
MALDQKTDDELKYLDLRRLRAHWDKVLGDATKDSPSYHKFLKELIALEAADRRERQRLSRIRRGNIADPWVLETFPFARQPNLRKKFVTEMYDSLDYMKTPRDLVFMGPTGCGKSGLATSFLIHAMNHGYRCYFIDFKQLLLRLYQSVADHTEKKVLKKFQTYDAIIIDELGYAPIEKDQAGLFFDLMKQRHNKKTTMITSQLGFDDWGSFLKNPHLTAALIDRMTVNCTVFNMRKCISIREKKITYGTTDD